MFYVRCNVLGPVNNVRDRKQGECNLLSISIDTWETLGLPRAMKLVERIMQLGTERNLRQFYKVSKARYRTTQREDHVKT